MKGSSKSKTANDCLGDVRDLHPGLVVVSPSDLTPTVNRAEAETEPLRRPSVNAGRDDTEAEPLRHPSVNAEEGISTGHHSRHQLTPQANFTYRRVRWCINMALVNLIEFSSESSRGLTLPSLFLYIQALGGGLKELGILSSLFSGGRLISSIGLGYLSDKLSFRTAYLLSAVVCIGSSALYIMAHEKRSIGILALSRFMSGVGTGCRSVCRANVSIITTSAQRLRYMSILSMSVFFGFAVTPGLGVLLQGYSYKIAGLELDTYTLPGLALGGLNACVLFLLFVAYDSKVTVDDGNPYDYMRPSHKDSLTVASTAGATKRKQSQNNSYSDREIPEQYIRLGVLLFMFLNFVGRGILSIFETLTTFIFLNARHIDPSEENKGKAVLEASKFYLYLGLAGMVTYVIIDRTHEKISEIRLLIVGFVFMLIGNLVLIPRPNNKDISQLIIGEGFTWSVGSPIVSTVTIVTFSKLLGSRPQGVYMGLIGSVGSVARIILPFLVGFIKIDSITFAVNALSCGGGAFLVWLYERKFSGSARTGFCNASETKELETSRPPSTVFGKQELEITPLTSNPPSDTNANTSRVLTKLDKGVVRTL